MCSDSLDTADAAQEHEASSASVSAARCQQADHARGQLVDVKTASEACLAGTVLLHARLEAHPHTTEVRAHLDLNCFSLRELSMLRLAPASSRLCLGALLSWLCLVAFLSRLGLALGSAAAAVSLPDGSSACAHKQTSAAARACQGCVLS